MSNPPPVTANDSGTVKFDVGGHLYTVSRSLIETFPTTMLARMASETWQKDRELTLFIDENGERFQYCLDYMRHNEVWLPLDVPKEVLLRDLDFYGFSNVDPETIRGGSSNLAAAQHLAKCKNDHDKIISTRKAAVVEIELSIACEEVAYECFLRYSRGAFRAWVKFPSCRLSPASDKHRTYESMKIAASNQAELETHLAKYGFSLMKINAPPVEVSILGFSPKPQTEHFAMKLKAKNNDS
jgi:hypothetical protein